MKNKKDKEVARKLVDSGELRTILRRNLLISDRSVEIVMGWVNIGIAKDMV